MERFSEARTLDKTCLKKKKKKKKKIKRKYTQLDCLTGAGWHQASTEDIDGNLTLAFMANRTM